LGDVQAQDRFVTELARARRVGRELARHMRGGSPAIDQSSDATLALQLESSPKPEGEPRFSLPSSQALEHAMRLRDIIGVTRIGMIGELSEIGGVQVAQAARPGNAWSSSYGSGKSRSKDGAVIGSILEETEKWAQEQFTPAASSCRVGSFEGLAREVSVVDPGMLDLPYDSPYRPDTPLTWYPCVDLLASKETLVPLDVIRMARGKHDICYTQRGARKLMITNGLGSGFTRAEAILHATCECVERHAARLAELFLSNPGGLGPSPYRFVDLSRANEPIVSLSRQLAASGATVRVLDITSDIEIPTFWAAITQNLRRADGYGTHPNPTCAMEMALLEAAQTLAGSTAAGREDLSIHARSLGRHERPRPAHLPSAWTWLDPDPEYQSPQHDLGYVSGDIRDDIAWCLERIRNAGLRQLAVADLGQPAIAPAHVVRVIIPGLESNNPFYTGARARLVLLRDMLPRWR
jgi:ribosomal protein S12 methylthiotransferase accessory factor